MKIDNKAPVGSALGALGIVYGDIGTSVLYAFRECIEHGIRDQEGILGILSLIIWTLTLLVTFKYVTFVTRADNQGEGGILALLSLAFPESVTGGAEKSKLAAVMIAIGVTGAALLYGDGVITPRYFGGFSHGGFKCCGPKVGALYSASYCGDPRAPVRLPK